MRNDMLLGAGTQAIAGGVNELGTGRNGVRRRRPVGRVRVGRRPHGRDSQGRRQHRSPAPGGSSGPTHALQSNNLNDELRAQGITAVNKLDFNWDNNVAVGGPIKKNKVWYFAAFELSQFNILVANVFFADGSQADTGGHVKPNGTARLTLQASTKDKVSFGYYNSTSLTDRYDFSATTTPEAGLRVNSPLNYSGVAEVDAHGDEPAAARSRPVGRGVDLPLGVPAGSRDLRSGEAESATGVTQQRVEHRAGRELQQQLQHAWSTSSYVTGSHAIKTGLACTTGCGHTKVEPHGDIVRLTFLNNAQGVPTSERGDRPQLAGRLRAKS